MIENIYKIYKKGEFHVKLLANESAGHLSRLVVSLGRSKLLKAVEML